jgi:hypothetical protein
MWVAGILALELAGNQVVSRSQTIHAIYTHEPPQEIEKQFLTIFSHYQ